MADFESKWVRLVRRRYEPPANAKMSYADENNLLWLLNAPEQYQVEEKMFAYAADHPEANMEDLMKYFDSIVPDGLSPEDNGEDLVEDN